jgi:phage shock protein A
MSAIKRLSATLSANLDKWVGEIENHDAVIEVAIRDARQNTARAKVRLDRLFREGEQMRDRLEQLQNEAESWRQRACKVAEKDVKKALACLQRHHDSKHQMEDLKQAINRHQSAQSKLAEQVRFTETRLREMVENRNHFRARESVVEASRSLAKIHDLETIDSDATFERWETQIMVHEIEMQHEPSGDPLKEHFLQAEERERLINELRQLTQEEQNRE